MYIYAYQQVNCYMVAHELRWETCLIRKHKLMVIKLSKNCRLVSPKACPISRVNPTGKLIKIKTPSIR